MIKKNYAVLELGKLEYHETQYSIILGSSTFFEKKKKNKKKNLHSTRVYQTRVLCNLFIYLFFFLKKKVLEPGILEYCVNGTRVYQARVLQNFF